MVNGFIKSCLIVLGMTCACVCARAEYKVAATPLTHDVKDLSERTSKVFDQNGERCALIKMETAIPQMYTFNLGAQQIEKRVNMDDEIWIWVSADVKKMSIHCADCTPLKDYRVALKPGNVYRVKLTTGLPIETSTTQYLNLYCEQVPYSVSIDGAEPRIQDSKNFYTELPIGAHTVTVSAKFYQTYSAPVRLERSRAYNDTIELIKNYGELVVHANMANYEVLIDGEKRDFASIYKVEPGVHYITVMKDKYKTVQDTISMTLGGRTEYRANFVPNFTIVTISSREPRTEIWVDDSLRGHDKLTLELLYGTHRIEGRRQGFDVWECPIHEFTSQTERNIQIPKLNQQFGSLRLSIFPQDAAFYLDGVQKELRDGIYNDKQVSAGLHYVYVRLTDYQTIHDSVVISPSKMETREYHMVHVPQGIVTIETDWDVGIFVAPDNEEPIFLGSHSFHGKVHAGENTIMLKNTKGDLCYYHIFVTDGIENPSIVLPFYRKLMVRSNVPMSYVSLAPKGEKAPFQLNKQKMVSPLTYVLQASKRGYQNYVDTIDLSLPDVQALVYHVDMRKEGDSTMVYHRPAPAAFQRFYDNAGRWFIGIVDIGYTYSFADTTHIVSFGLAPFRYTLLGVSLLDFEMPVYGRNQWNMYYNPKLSLVLPFGKGGGCTVYGGLNINLKNKDIPTCLRGGISFLVNKAGAAPFQIFGEYRHPLQDDGTNKIQRFRVGINFAFGLDM